MKQPHLHVPRNVTTWCLKSSCMRALSTLVLLQDAPFFTVKLQIKVLPCMVLFCKGVAMDRVVGFDDFGGKDDFSLAAVERRLLTCGVVKAAPKNEDSDDDLQEHVRRSVHVSKAPRTASDEDSDFGD